MPTGRQQEPKVVIESRAESWHDSSTITVGPFLEVPGLTEEQPDLAVDASGASLVIWPQWRPDASGPPTYTEQVLGQRFTPSGKPSGQPFEVTPSSTPRSLSIGPGPPSPSMPRGSSCGPATRIPHKRATRSPSLGVGAGSRTSPPSAA